MTRRFQTVDVFSRQHFKGNPLPVIFDADDISTEKMQQITQWMNLSETVFLVKPTDPAADYRVRIFTLDKELPFAGHPTLGSCHAWLTAGGQPRNDSEIVQECGAGLVTIRRTAQGLAFAAPPLIRSGEVSDEEQKQIMAFLNISRDAIVDMHWADNGPGWVVVLLKDAQAVLDVEPSQGHSSHIDVGVVGAYPPGSPANYELRALFTDQNGATREDPVTGSLNASVAQWLYASGRVTGDFVASQGTRLGRAGRISLSKDELGRVWVGGSTTTLFEGQTNF